MSFENLPALSVMIGRNNAGKSNLIKALDWYASMRGRNAEFSTNLLHSGDRDKPLIVNVQFELSCDERESVITTSAHYASTTICHPMLPFVAFMISWAISSGWDRAAAWLEFSERVVALIRSANIRSASGGTTWSASDT